ncbi:hypothetical protein IH980_00255 [Patescibacteria group bacterium]|nr:hypothetical protein [Patescibacteria group bacterium]
MTKEAVEGFLGTITFMDPGAYNLLMYGEMSEQEIMRTQEGLDAEDIATIHSAAQFSEDSADFGGQLADYMDRRYG